MRGKHLVYGLFAMAAVMPAATACSHNGEAPGDIAPADRIFVHAKNNNFYDMDLYAVADGLATRIGTVAGNAEQNFVVSSSLAVQDFRIVASPIGGWGRASTGTLNVAPGQTVDFTIGSTLRNSTVFIR
jgi:hypothetical protein